MSGIKCPPFGDDRLLGFCLVPSAALFVLSLDPLKEGRLVNQHPTSPPAHNRVAAVGLGLEDHPAEASDIGPRVMFWPLVDGDEASLGGCFVTWLRRPRALM